MGTLPLVRPALALCIALISAGMACAVSPEERAREQLAARIGSLWSKPDGEHLDEARRLLRLAQKLHAEGLEKALRNRLASAGLGRIQWAGGTEGDARALELRRALADLELAQPDDGKAVLARARAKAELGELAAAVQELEQYARLFPEDLEGRCELARVRWRMGDIDRAMGALEEGIESAWQRDGTELLARMLRTMKRAGHPDRARKQLAKVLGRVEKLERGTSAWIQSLPALSPLRVLAAEDNLEQADLSGALAVYRDVGIEDRTWLVGGMVRVAREAAARSPADRERVLAQIDGLKGEAVDIPAPLMRFAADLHAAAGRPERSLRYYAASVTAGEPEAGELVERFRKRARAAGAPGAVVKLLAAAGKAPPVLEEGAVEPLRSLAFFEDPTVVGERVLAQLHKSGRRDVDAALAQLSLEAASMVPERRTLVSQVLRGDLPGARATLDGLALTAWQVDVPGMLRPTGASVDAANLDAVRSDVRPRSLEAMARALKDLNDPEQTEQRRIASTLEVARQASNLPPRVADPLAIDMDGNGAVELTDSFDESASANFDLDGWGRPARVQWLVKGRDGWLCEDADGDGQIRSGRELFGTAGGYTDGFEKLALRDRNGDGAVAGDELAGLSIWIDGENPGQTDPGELTDVRTAGLESVSIPKIGLRSASVVRGKRRLVVEVWPVAIGARFTGVFGW